ncbi:MAG: cation-transporting P-type ATPase [Deltaproteobacteria bacterium]
MPPARANTIRASPRLLELAGAEPAAAYARLATTAAGLSSTEARTRLAEFGPNRLASDRPPGLVRRLWHAMRNPLVILLATLATVSFATADPRAGAISASRRSPPTRSMPIRSSARVRGTCAR